jgi:hypothetical protein
MAGFPVEPRWLVGTGVVLLAAGYAALAAGPDVSRLVLGPARLAFYGGLAILVTGVVIWLRQPPRPDPDEHPDEPPASADPGG